MNVLPLNEALIQKAIESEGWVNADDLVIPFEGGDAHVSIEGADDDILVVRLSFPTPASADQVDDAIETWHREHLWPTIQRQDGAVLTEVAGYYPTGITVEQVATQINCATATSLAFAKTLP